MADLSERVAWSICREQHPCWSIVGEIMSQPDYHPGHEGDVGARTDAGWYREFARAAIAVCAEEMAPYVERSFRDGFHFGAHVETTPDKAWESSKVRADFAAAIRSMGERGE